MTAETCRLVIHADKTPTGGHDKRYNAPSTDDLERPDSETVEGVEYSVRQSAISSIFTQYNHTTEHFNEIRYVSAMHIEIYSVKWKLTIF